MNQFVVIGYVMDDPVHRVFRDGRQRLCFRIVDIRKARGRKAESKYAVNHGFLDDRIQKGREVVVTGTLKPRIKKGVTYLNLDAMNVWVPNIPIEKTPQRLTQYWERPDADEDDPDEILSVDPGSEMWDATAKVDKGKDAGDPEGDWPSDG